MEPTSDHMTDAAAEPVSSRKKPVRFKFGIGLLILNSLMWLFAAVVPFLPLEAGTKAGVIAGDLVAAEVIFLLGVACVGKETYQALKAKLFRKQRDAALEAS